MWLASNHKGPINSILESFYQCFYATRFDSKSTITAITDKTDVVAKLSQWELNQTGTTGLTIAVSGKNLHDKKGLYCSFSRENIGCLCTISLCGIILNTKELHSAAYCQSTRHPRSTDSTMHKLIVMRGGYSTPQCDSQLPEPRERYDKLSSSSLPWLRWLLQPLPGKGRMEVGEIQLQHSPAPAAKHVSTQWDTFATIPSTTCDSHLECYCIPQSCAVSYIISISQWPSITCSINTVAPNAAQYSTINKKYHRRSYSHSMIKLHMHT